MMRSFLLPTLIALAAVACSGIEEGAVHAPDTPGDAADAAGEPGGDPGGPDASADEGPRQDAPALDDGVQADDAPLFPDDGLEPDDSVTEDEVSSDDGTDPGAADVLPDAEAFDNPDAEVPPGTIAHFGWFGPGGVLTGNGMSSLGSLSGPQQAWQVK